MADMFPDLQKEQILLAVGRGGGAKKHWRSTPKFRSFCKSACFHFTYLTNEHPSIIFCAFCHIPAHHSPARWPAVYEGLYKDQEGVVGQGVK